jgi:hypothetical protein
LVSTEDAVFADLTSAPAIEAKVITLGALLPPGSTAVAHSAGAVTALLAIARRVISVDALVLLEPALYDVARGVPAIERHIDAMTRARALADAGHLFGYWSVVRPMMFGGPAEPYTWDTEQGIAARFASIELPWGHGVTPDMIAGVPTLVITGGWNEEYEAIANALTAEGAIHQQLIGNGHRPQDHPDFEAVVQRFVSSRALRER